MKCKNCNINDATKYSKYTSGEFCSKKCSCSYSTKEKRFEINKNVSNKLKGRISEKRGSILIDGKYILNPDLDLFDFNFYVEYKGWITKEMSHKMNDALSKNNFNLLIIYSNDKRYRDLGLNIKQLQSNNKILFNYIK